MAYRSCWKGSVVDRLEKWIAEVVSMLGGGMRSDAERKMCLFVEDEMWKRKE